MNFVKPKFEFIIQKYEGDLLENMFKHIEICGRNCYKSEDHITDKSYEGFVKNLMEHEHGAMLEHGTVYLTIPIGTPVDDIQYIWKTDIVKFFADNKYSVVKSKTINKTVDVEIKGYGLKTQASAKFYFITTNWRVICENKDFEILKYMGQFKSEKESLEQSVLQWMTPPMPEHEKRYTIAFTYHLAAARDVNRHRVQSVAEESTRYCNYTKEKFQEGNNPGLNIVAPERIGTEAAQDNYNQWITHKDYSGNLLYDMCQQIVEHISEDWSDIDWWMFANVACQESYNILKTQFDWSNQECSLILPLDTKTCSIHTAFVKDWIHFFNLRALGTTGKPRPSIQNLAIPLMLQFINGEIIKPEQLNQKYWETYLKKNELEWKNMLS